LTPEVNCARAAPATPITASAIATVAVAAARQATVIQSADPSEHFQGAPPMGIGVPELIIILIIIIMIFGASRLPEIGRGIGKGIRNFKDATREGVANKHDD
jgi:sec-independent protein translocase protein TatA